MTQATEAQANSSSSNTTNSANIENKTPDKTSSETKKAPGIIRTAAKNPLSFYRSYTYNFTLASLKNRALQDPESYKVNQDYYVILKSGGKGTAGIQSSTSNSPTQGLPAVAGDNPNTSGNATSAADAQALVNNFNTNSPGRFDMYINNVNIESLIGGGERSSMSLATNIDFEVFEPYSMTGFLEALQVSAVAAGHQVYTECPYLLKMEFIGYHETRDYPEVIPNSTRYFVFGFTGIEIDVTNEGARYRCKGVPFNEKAFGEASVLKSDIKMEGNTVEQILDSFFKGINTSIQRDAKQEQSAENTSNYDEYEIYFPKITETGMDTAFLNGSYQKNNIATATVTELLKTNNVYSFADPSQVENNQSSTVNPTQVATQFAKESTIYDCVISVVRDSSYTSNILKDFKPDDTGMVNYFMVHIDSEKKGVYDTTKNREYYKYRYVVIEYKMHYTRIQPRPATTVDTEKLKAVINREYHYFYTGKNTDIIQFNLKFNSLFFQAIPKAMANKETFPAAAGGVQSNNPATAKVPTTTSADKANSAVGSAPVVTSGSSSAATMSGNQNATFTQSDPYTDLAKNMHKAILENVDQCQADITVIGDPYYLVTDGTGNQHLKTNPTDKTAGEGEAPVYTQDVHILITFRNPVDIDTNSGFAFFDDKVALYSGVFRILKLKSQFKDGQFTQILETIRTPYQAEDTLKQPAAVVQLVESGPNPSKASTPSPAPPISQVRALTNNLISQITKGLPLTGLPGEIANLFPGGLGSLAGAIPGALTIGSLVNRVFSPSAGATGPYGSFINQLTGSVDQGFSNVESVIRLADSGLSALSTNINSAGGSVNQLAQTAQSIGLTNVTSGGLAKTLLVAGDGSVQTLGTNAMSAVDNLGGNASGLMSEVSSRVDRISGNSSALASQLGLNPEILAGLSSDLRSSIEGQLQSAASSVPNDVDIASALRRGLILNNIPTDALGNIPATQPDLTAPYAKLNLNDIQFILNQGGSLENIPGAFEIPGVNELLSGNGSLSVDQSFGLNSSVLAGKLSTIQQGLSQISGSSRSVEASLNSISALVPDGVPYTQNVTQSVINQFGGSRNSTSPLAQLVQNNLVG